ncbi:MAG TPA: FAD-binding oxidoreductase [Actinomycetota bacterium]
MSVADPGRVDVGALAGRFSGQLLGAGDEGYDEARRVWNADIDRRPAVIARCESTADIAAAVRFARERELAISVRGGGHGVAGWAVCEGGVMIDLSPMRRIDVDPASGIVRADAGVQLGELDAATRPHGLAVPAGIVTHTGIAGLSLGGGIGWLMRAHGLTADHLVAADVVTADGEVARAEERHEPELLWGLRGGGGNFGIVSRFEYQAGHLPPKVLAGAVVYDGEDASRVLRGYAQAAAEAPDQITTIVTVRNAAPVPFLPDQWHGRPVVMVGVCHCGDDLDAAERDVGPFRSLGRRVADVVRPAPFTELQSMFDSSVPWGWGYYWKARYLASFDPPVVDTLLEHAWAHGSPRSYLIVFQMGGAVRHVDEDATAFTGRDAAFALNINGIWTDPADRAGQVAWTRDVFDATEPFQSGVYVNFLGDEGGDRVREAYGEDKFARLARLKRATDPDNALRLNQNVPPAP